MANTTKQILAEKESIEKSLINLKEAMGRKNKTIIDPIKYCYLKA